eukprot:3475803-Prymnesium_polylepis.1
MSIPSPAKLVLVTTSNSTPLCCSCCQCCPSCASLAPRGRRLGQATAPHLGLEHQAAQRAQRSMAYMQASLRRLEAHVRANEDTEQNI